jgi:hypothetical protein
MTRRKRQKAAMARARSRAAVDRLQTDVFEALARSVNGLGDSLRAIEGAASRLMRDSLASVMSQETAAAVSGLSENIRRDFPAIAQCATRPG